MGDGRSGAEDESWTEMEGVRPELDEAVPVRHGMVLGGRYAIEKIIGRGGSGVVVRAQDRDLRQVVAIKIVRAELAGQRVWAERLAREVRLARQIQHPHVCRVFDFQQADGRVFLVMELAAQGTLRDEIRSGALAARALGERIADARAVASALAAIHAAGIVHRDLTPQNLLRMGDGRLVLSDFGLATDASESTSVHGGTVAYMAPEVMRGGKASFASDIWALGVVMHELVFGTKPRWRDGDAGEMLRPALGRTLTTGERAAFEACRACTAKEPARRIARADEAGRMLTERRRWRSRVWGAARRPAAWAAALTVVAAVVAGVVRARWRAVETRGASAAESPLIVPSGEAADWTDVSTVIAEVPERIQCTRLLPDQRTIRFVWGSPPRAEDIDTVTRERVPSPLVPAAYAEGCPDLSPDGKRLLYQGHAKDGRAFAFLSDPDGRDATPIVPTAEPSMSSEPTWLSDGAAFSYDIDTRHMGVFSVAENRTRVLPEVTAKPVATLFRNNAIGNLVFLSTIFESTETELAGISVPSMEEIVRFRVPEVVLDLRSIGSRLYYVSSTAPELAGLTEVNASNRQAFRRGYIRDQVIRNPSFTADGLAFVSLWLGATVIVRGPDGAVHRWAVRNSILLVARCGRDIVVSRRRGDSMIIERTDNDGNLLAPITNGPWDVDPACSPDGQVVFYVRSKSRPGIMRCVRDECQSIVDGSAWTFSLSPAGRRLAFITLEKQGPIVKLMDVERGQARVLTETETSCKPEWSSETTLWVSRRRNGKIVWTEVDTESGHETGRSLPGSRDCADGKSDPLSPVQPEARVIYDQTSQLRLLGRQYLQRN